MSGQAVSPFPRRPRDLLRNLAVTAWLGSRSLLARLSRDSAPRPYRHAISAKNYASDSRLFSTIPSPAGGLLMRILDESESYRSARFFQEAAQAERGRGE